MRIFLGFDDTDTADADQGTGKLVRRFEDRLPEGCRMQGVVRQQLLLDDAIPYTSHNSAACMLIEADHADMMESIIRSATGYVEKFSLKGSDPGICVACEDSPSMPGLTQFGFACTRQVMTQKGAIQAASGAHLSGHGGTNDGIIGAAAAVGLTASGWCGRFIEWGRLRDFPDKVRVSDLENQDIRVISIDRNAQVPGPDDQVLTNNWLRPRVLGHQPVLMVAAKGDGVWEHIGRKRKNSHRNRCFLTSN